VAKNDFLECAQFSKLNKNTVCFVNPLTILIKQINDIFSNICAGPGSNFNILFINLGVERYA